MSAEHEVTSAAPEAAAPERAPVLAPGSPAVQRVLALQRSAGNRAVGRWLARADVTTTTDPRLNYRPNTEVDQAGLGAERLPYTDPKEAKAGWNAREILNKLTQRDEDDYTFSDSVRCAANAALAIAIMAGPIQTASFAQRVGARATSRITIKVDKHEALSEAKQAELDRSMDNLGAAALSEFAASSILYGWGTYKDLDQIAHATKVAMSAKPHDFSTGAEAVDMARGAGTTTTMYGQIKSRKDFEAKLKALKSGSAYIVNVDTDVLAAGAKAERDQGNHFVTVGRLPGGSEGEYFLYDPIPRTGDQFVMSSSTDFWTLFENAGGEWKWVYIESMTVVPEVKVKK